MVGERGEGSFFLTSSKRWRQKRPKGEEKAAVRIKDLEVGAEGSFASKETKTKRKAERRRGWGEMPGWAVRSSARAPASTGKFRDEGARGVS